VPCALCSRGLVNAQIAMVVMRWRDGSMMRRTPSVLSDLWDDALFNGLEVDWGNLRLK